MNLRKTTIALVTGNGFDRDLGIPSSFSQFAESNEWKNLLTSFHVNQYNRLWRGPSLLWHLNNSIKPNWFDVEEEIHQFINKHPSVSKKQSNKIQMEYEGLTQAFHNYLLRVTKDFKVDKKKLAYQLLCQLPKCPVYITDYSFNYTKPEFFLDEQPDFPELFHFTRCYVHGSLRDNDIIIGCDVQNDEKVNKPLSFMYKYNKLKQTNFISLSLAEAREVIFFGHSLNEMDFCYFREFFKKASSSYEPLKDVTIITWDENSERDIKNNIRNQGISVTDLYNNLFTFTFIHSSKIYKGDKEENEKWKDLLFRITTDRKTEI
ncbi:MAG: hypothetical protein IJJ73_03495 [Bacteroidaceae bacterium]|nr:hypothetical protein [Bacteroidaceae bacterium]